MGKLKIKTIRFFVNLILYAVVLISTTYYTYTFQPGLFALKNVIIPLQGTIILAVVLAVILAGVNEIMTMIIIKFSMRGIEK